MTRWLKSHKRRIKSDLRKAAKRRPMVWKHMFGGWGVGGYTRDGYKFFGRFDRREDADALADLIHEEANQ